MTLVADDTAKPKYPWDDWDDAKKAQFDKALALAEGIKLYRSAGGIGQGAQYAPHSRALEAQGGLPPDQATLLARYRMYKNGATDIPIGDRPPPETPEMADLRRQQFLASSPVGKAKMIEEQKPIVQRQLGEGHFDSLVTPAKPPTQQDESPPPDKARVLAASIEPVS